MRKWWSSNSDMRKVVECVMGKEMRWSSGPLLLLLLLVLDLHAWFLPPPAHAKPWPRPSSSSPTTRRFHFNLEWKMVSRVCRTKSILTVNGQYPGPTIAVREGDSVVVKVTNSADRNTTIHWHGIRQFRTGWADGPAYVTQCPIQSKHSYSYRFTVEGQRGTLLWHAHYRWQRATVHGAFVVYPKSPYPFPGPIRAEVPIILGEWWNRDIEAIEEDVVHYGAGPDKADAHTINGMPGPQRYCFAQDTFVQDVEAGKTYMLRIINAALDTELFFAVANHTLTVVEADAAYLKPFPASAIVIASGQTTTVLLTADRTPPPGSLFAIAIRPYIPSAFPVSNGSAIGYLRYMNSNPLRSPAVSSIPANLPLPNDTASATNFARSLRSLNSAEYPCKVPKEVDKVALLALSINLQDCCRGCTCKGMDGKRFSASINNQSFVLPPTAFLQSYYTADPSGRTSLNEDFPLQPPHRFNYTANADSTTNLNPGYGSKLMVVPYGAAVELVLQDTAFVGVDSHSLHLHGHNFFIVGSGFGDFDRERDVKGYNLVDPPERNTVGVPAGGWAAIRFTADNPGVWFVHCHMEVHTAYGLAVGIIVENGPRPSQSILPPPKDLPPC